jgi:hypothetical protein
MEPSNRMAGCIPGRGPRLLAMPGLSRLPAMLKRWLMILCAGCGTTASSGPQSGDVLQTGGEVRVADMPARNIEVGETALVVWGMTEVPGNSRMQAAEAMVDAITRAELLKFVQVGVGSMQLDVVVVDGEVTHQQIELITVEVVQAKLPSATLIQHGWEKVPGDNGITLRLVGRLEVSRELFRETLAESMPPAQADAIITHLFRRK